MLCQVPYAAITLTTFDYLDRELLIDKDAFNKNDEVPFLYKFLHRFGASTLSLMFVQTLLYPLDTVKRCLQVNGAIGHKDLYSGTLDCLGKLFKDGGVRMLYQGLTANLLRCAPVTMIQFLVFQATKRLVEERDSFENPVLKTKMDRLKYA